MLVKEIMIQTYTFGNIKCFPTLRNAIESLFLESEVRMMVLQQIAND